MSVFCLPDSKAIVDGNLKLILGLIWTLILHYSISMPVWEDEGDDDAKKQTPKQRLLGWIQNKIPYLPITNFNQNWQDGKALGALVDSCAPGKPFGQCFLAPSSWGCSAVHRGGGFQGCTEGGSKAVRKTESKEASCGKQHVINDLAKRNTGLKQNVRLHCWRCCI